MTDQNQTFLDAVANGDIPGMLAVIPWDAFEVIPCMTMELYLGLSGQTMVAGKMGEGEFMVHVHDTVDGARECFAEKLATTKRMLKDHLDKLDKLGQDQGLPPEVRALLARMRAEAPEGTEVHAVMLPGNGNGPRDQYAIGRDAAASGGGTEYRGGMYL